MSAVPERSYLDHNAGAPLLPEAREALLRALDGAGNPSSVHGEGRRARRIVEEARRAVGALTGATPEAVIFTSGASEGATTCLSPDWVVDGESVVLSRLAVLATDHPATRAGGAFAENRVERLAVTPDGVLRFEALDRWLESLGPDEPALLALGLANGETGAVQPAAAVAERLRDRRVVFVLDGAQAPGRMDVSLDGLGADVLILSGHKMGAPQGVGATILRDEATRPLPLMRGGSQQKGRRAGTEPAALIAALGAAAGVAAGRTSNDRRRMAGLRDGLGSTLLAALPGLRIVGRDAPERLVNTICLQHPGLKAATAQIALDLAGFAVSSGSACSSGKVGPSDALAAMAAAGAPIEPDLGALRVSIGWDTTREELERFARSFMALASRAVPCEGSRDAA